MTNLLYEKAHIESAPKQDWDGENKAISRDIKRDYVESFGFGDPVCLTIPGAHAIFEEMLIDSGLAEPGNIVGIERNKIIFSSLRKKATKLGIRAYNVDLLRLTKFLYPDYLQNPNSKIGHRAILAKGVDVFDLDTMNSIGQSMVHSIANIFNHRMPSHESAMMINNVRGRYHPQGPTFTTMRRTLIKLGFDFSAQCTSSIMNKPPLDIQQETLLKTSFAFVAVPVYYSCLAAIRGYSLSLEKIIDYRDKNQKSGKGNCMAQYLFSCIRTGNTTTAMKAVVDNERQARRAVLEEIPSSMFFDHYDAGGLYTKHID